MICKKDEKSLEIAAESLKKGDICILPTDTVYGFSGIVDLKGKTSFKTDDKIRKIKGREENKPLIELISQAQDLFLYTDEKIPDSVLNKWPGPLTIIVKVKEDSPLAEKNSTVAFRCPGDEWLRKLIAKCGAPLYSTSVNKSGEPVLDEVDAIKNTFEKDVDLIVADGDKKNAVPSTIISLDEKDSQSVKILRQGAVIL